MHRAGAKQLKRGVCGWLGHLAAILAVVAQLAVAIAPLAERTDAGAPAHLDPAGTSAHYVHNDADCAACQARSLHGATARAPSPPLPRLASPVAPVATAAFSTAADPGRHLSRAPPA
jgi:hypothetical protein